MFNYGAACKFSAEVTFSTLEKMRYDFEQQRRFLIENLTPPIASLPEKYSRVILYLVIYWRACITESISSKCLLNNLIETERKEAIR